VRQTLIPNDLRKNIPNLYDTEELQELICQVKLFTPFSSFTWYIIELSQDDNDTCFGYVEGLDNELGYFSLSEIESIVGPMGLRVERDLSFKPTKLSDIKSKS
jgi:hypothetical protein